MIPEKGTGGSVGVDPGEPNYLAHLTSMFTRSLNAAPQQAALIVDRGDWCGLFNIQRDDGYSWFAGANLYMGMLILIWVC